MPISSSTRLQQVKADLLDYITKSGLKRNDPLPSEAALAKTFGVSRNTVREAYILLEKEGVIVRRHGIGTFVASSNVIRDPLNEFLPFAQIIRKSGYIPSFQTLSMNFEEVPSSVGDVLNITPSTRVRRIKRLVLADERPVIYVDDFVAPLVEGEGLDWNAFDGNMVEFLSTSRSFTLNQIQSRIRITTLSPEVSRYLNLPEGGQALNVWSTIFTTDNQPVTLSEVCFNSDIIEMNIVRNLRT
ncbi:MAG: GntR family transcriptional regulator [Anaerolineales bacterium]|nr:GntR family transcriptional regulator [Anaerolineales bacterium]